MSTPENEQVNILGEHSTQDNIVFVNRTELTENFIFTSRKPPVKKEEPTEAVQQVSKEQEETTDTIETVEEPIEEIEIIEDETPETTNTPEQEESLVDLTKTEECETNEIIAEDKEEIPDIENEEVTSEVVEPIAESAEEVEIDDNAEAIDEDELVDDSEETEDVETTEEVVVDKEALQQTINNNIKKFETKKKNQQMISKIASGCLWAVGLFLLVLCCSNLYQQMFNAENYTGFFGVGNAIVVSNSMEPNISVNDLVFYHNTDIDNISTGDIIVYKSKRAAEEERLIVHRVVDIADGYVTTQGDNNATPDAAIEYENVVGKYMFKVGKIGAFFSLMATKWAPLIAVAIIWLIIIVRIAIYFVHKKKTIEQITSDEGNREALDHF